MIYQGDCLDILPTLEANIIQCCVTSPPYYGLRDYGCAGQIGLEPTPDAYVEKLVAVFREVRRVLKDDGTLWLNLGDSYAGSMKGANGDGTWQDRSNCKQGTNIGALNIPPQKASTIGLKPKDMIGIPWRVAFALQADGWYLRQDIIWAKPNPMPESVTDRCTKSHEYIFLLTKSARYYYDNEAIKEPVTQTTIERSKYRWQRTQNGGGSKESMSGYDYTNNDFGEMHVDLNVGRNLRSVWTIATRPYREAHFATFPEEIPRTCILAGSKKGDTILDPFSGAGTTGVVAEKLDRKYIGIELNPQYTKLAEDRIYNVQPLFAGLGCARGSGYAE